MGACVSIDREASRLRGGCARRVVAHSSPAEGSDAALPCAALPRRPSEPGSPQGSPPRASCSSARSSTSADCLLVFPLTPKAAAGLRAGSFSPACGSPTEAGAAEHLIAPPARGRAPRAPLARASARRASADLAALLRLGARALQPPPPLLPPRVRAAAAAGGAGAGGGAAGCSEPLARVRSNDSGRRRSSCCAAIFSHLGSPRQAAVASAAADLCCTLFEASAAAVVLPGQCPPPTPCPSGTDGPCGAPAASGSGAPAAAAAPAAGCPAARVFAASGADAEWPPQALAAAAGAALAGLQAAPAAGAAAPPAVLVARGEDVRRLTSGAAGFLAAAPLLRSGGTGCDGAIILFGGVGKAFTADQAALLLQIAQIVARDVPATPPQAVPQLPPAAPAAAAAGAQERPRLRPLADVQLLAPPQAPRDGAKGVIDGAASSYPLQPYAGAALVGCSPGWPLLLMDDTFHKYMGTAPGSPALAEGLWRLLRAPAPLAARCSAAARVGAAFEASCVSQRLGGSMHLKLTFLPCPGARGGSGGGGGPSAGAPAPNLDIYLVSVDFLNASDAAMWAPDGAAVPFRLLPGPGAE